MEKLKNVSVACTYEVDNSYDSEKFIKLRLRVMHDGVNPNNSNFILENIEKARPSMANIPILAYYYFDENGEPQFSVHAMHLEVDKTNENQIRLIYDEVPIGLVPETNNYEIKKYNGRNYVYTDAYIWRGYCNYAEDIINRDKEINISMEIAVDAYNYNEELKCYDITDYRYTGITLLGNDVGTGMIDAKATTSIFSLEEKKEKMVVLMQELKNELAFKHIQFSQKGGQLKLTDEVKNNILAEFSLKIEDLDFEITDDMTEEAFREAIKKFVENKESNANKSEISFSATYKQKKEALSNALERNIVRDENGNVVEETIYYVEDFDDTYVYVEKDVWTVNDFNQTYGRFTYTFDETTLTATITGEFEEMVLVWLTTEENQRLQEERANYEALKKEYEEYKKNYSTPNSKVEELEKFQKDILDKQKENLFAQFDEELSSVEEYSKIKENANNYSIDELSEKLFALFGKKKANFSSKKKNDGMPKVPVGSLGTNDDPYGGLLSKYYEN